MTMMSYRAKRWLHTESCSCDFLRCLILDMQWRSCEPTVLFPPSRGSWRCSFRGVFALHSLAVLKLMHAYCICTYISVCTWSCKNVDTCKEMWFLCQARLWESDAIRGDLNLVQCFLQAFSCRYEPMDLSCSWLNGDCGFVNDQLGKAWVVDHIWTSSVSSLPHTHTHTHVRLNVLRLNTLLFLFMNIYGTRVILWYAAVHR